MGGAEASEYQPSAAICEPLVEQSWKLQHELQSCRVPTPKQDSVDCLSSFGIPQCTLERWLNQEIKYTFVK